MCLPRAPAEYSGRYRNLLYDKVSALYYSLMYDIAPRTHLGWAGDYQGALAWCRSIIEAVVQPKRASTRRDNMCLPRVSTEYAGRWRTQNVTSMPGTSHTGEPGI